ncbi:MAG: hypothetical protein N4A63_17620 [Vallitalea sp.]|jgi:cell division protein FtsL|nr:hypothetical protein [Vallitalea sp.]
MNKDYRNNNPFYVVGNNATKLEPDYDNFNNENNNIHKRVTKKRKVKKYKYKMKILFLLSLTMMTFLVMIKTQSIVMSRCDNIVRLENQLNNLKKKNKLIEESINTNINLDKIYEIATTKLGMVVPNKNQVKEIKVKESSYTEQFAEITESIEERDNIYNIWGFILSNGR